MEEWKNGRMEEWKNGRMEEWKNGRIDVWMVGWKTISDFRFTVYDLQFEKRNCKMKIAN